MMYKIFFTGWLALLSVAGNAQLLNFNLLQDTAGQSVWHPTDDNQIAMAIKGADGYYDVYLTDTLGTAPTCITCSNLSLPGKHQGTPFFHPSGNYLAITVEKAVHPGISFEALPGIGGYSDIWVITSDGSQAWQITNTPNDSSGGVMLPRFSPDGTKILWTERTGKGDIIFQPAAIWVIKVADFIADSSGVSISNVQTYGQTNPGFYECYGWSPDGSKILFSSDFNQFSFWQNQVFTMNTDGTNVTQLTDNSGYFEQSSFTPDGNQIIYMSSKNNSNGGCDWWMMNSDTTNKHRITFFNDSTSAQYLGYPVYMGLTSFSPDGNTMVADILQDLFTQITHVYLVDAGNLTENDPQMNFHEVIGCSIYPNPFNASATIELNSEIRNSVLNVYNCFGQRIKSMNVCGKEIRLERENLADGLFYFQITENGLNIASGKFIVCP